MKPWLKAGSVVVTLALAATMGRFYEGKVNTAYQDMGGVWSLCYGHTKGVVPGAEATDDECLTMLQEDMGDALRTVQGCIIHPLTVAQAAAFTDATYNIGPKVVCGSTLQRLANSGDIQGACRQLTDAKGADGKPTGWTKVNGKVVQGLINRRIAERDLCLGGVE